jgi:hypothetical protein
MPEPRAILEREVERVPLRPYTLDTFRRGLLRRQRNARLRSGALGIAVTVAIAAAVVRAAGPSAPDVGTLPPSPSPSGAGVVPFLAPSNGYLLSYPPDWTLDRPDARWAWGEPPTDEVMEVFTDPEDGVMLGGASMRLPEGVTGEAWLDQEQRRYRAERRPSWCDRGAPEVLPIEIDGVAGRMVDCALILVVDGGRGYVFRLGADISVHQELRAVVRSIELQPAG